MTALITTTRIFISAPAGRLMLLAAYGIFAARHERANIYSHAENISPRAYRVNGRCKIEAGHSRYLLLYFATGHALCR